MIRRLVRGSRGWLRRLRDRVRDRVPRPAIRANFALCREVVRVLASAASGCLERIALRIRRARVPLRIGVDIRPFYEPLTGVGWYLHHLLDEMARVEGVELVLYGEAFRTSGGPRLHTTIPESCATRVFDFKDLELTRGGVALARAAYPLLAWLDGCDVFFGANYVLPRSLSAVATQRVVTVHDLTFRRHPELLQAETLETLEREMARELFRADAIVCVSEATRDDLLTYYGVEPRRAVTVHSGLPPIASADGSSIELPPRYVLFVSTIEPRKNLETLIDAFESLRDRGLYDGALVVAGKVGWKSERTVARMKTSRWRDSIRHLDYVARADLAEVYRRAELFVFPSLYEGFGFPLLEAMAQGVPAIAARNSSLPEIGGDAALYFDALDTGELTRVMQRVLEDPELRATLRARGLAQAARFEWARTARETIAVFSRVAGRDA